MYCMTLCVCSDVDECEQSLDDCDANAECVNVPGQFVCVCNQGYFFDGNGICCELFSITISV